jgi:ribonuclease HII
MPYLIATDEAGLGPNLGPLVVSATAWELPDGMAPEDLFDTLSDSIVPTAREADDERFAVADSKQLYKPGGTKAHLERGVLIALASLQRKTETWRALFDTLDPSSSQYRASIPWYKDYDEPLPLDIDAENLAMRCQRFADACRDSRVRLCEVRSRVVYPPEFNQQLATYGKGELLSHTTLGLAAELAKPLEGPVSIVCDKHGGRNRYADLLAHHFPDAFIEIHGEGRDLSAYAFGPADRRVEACFRTRAESILAVGLASMVSKYLRELSMRAFNRFWTEQVNDLRPTAGYPQDAKRFRADIADRQLQLGFDDDVLWRKK